MQRIALEGGFEIDAAKAKTLNEAAQEVAQEAAREATPNAAPKANEQKDNTVKTTRNLADAKEKLSGDLWLDTVTAAKLCAPTSKRKVLCTRKAQSLTKPDERARQKQRPVSMAPCNSNCALRLQNEKNTDITAKPQMDTDKHRFLSYGSVVLPLKMRFAMKNRIMTSLCLGAVLLSTLAPAQAGMFSVNPTQERKMGDEAAREIDAQARVMTGPVADWVASVGARLAATSDKEFTYSFKVVEGKEINAFALPGGHVYVFTGIRKIAQTDDELAAILAHEITHAEQHHFAKQYGKASKRGAILGVLSVLVGLPNVAQQIVSLADFAMSQKYSRTSETEADILGMQRMTRAGFNPAAMVSILERLAKEDESGGSIDHWFGDHPDAGRRIERARNQLTALNAGQGPKTIAQPADKSSKP